MDAVFEDRTPPERGDAFTGAKKRLFLVALRQGDSVLGACRLVGVSNRTAYNHRRRDPHFARAWDLARSSYSLPLELVAWERGVTGIEEDVYAYGKLSHVRVRRSDSLLVRLLQAEHPRKYGRGDSKRQRRVEKKLSALAARMECLEAQLSESGLRTPRKIGAAAVNFVNPGSRDPASAAPPLRRGRKRDAWRLAAARRRLERAESSRIPGGP